MAANDSDGCDPIDAVKSSNEVSLAIGVVARRAGIATSVIRYYEEIGLLPAPARLNGRRRYDLSTVQRLRVIAYAQQAGFTLGEIRELFFGFEAGTPPSVRWGGLVQRKLAELEAQVTRIHAMQSLLREGMSCGCLTIEQCTVWLSGLAPSA
ncbi:MAG TPA: MerR family transcriptional regulator [Ktedonobacterales bacterium]|jgi:MerR family transcriptional regulator, redox-sensitive transcriptional activator SoxR|nr:MerR family transcriptional regulator [Ktedonobacterales bacterium]